MPLKPDQITQAQDLLIKLPLFTGCPVEALAALVTKFDRKELAAGKVAMMDQEINRTLYLLASGAVGIWKRISNNKQQLATLTAPNFFGERSMFEESAASALVKTEGPSVVFTLDRSAFEEVAKQYPAIMPVIHKNMDAIRAQRMGPTTEPK